MQDLEKKLKETEKIYQEKVKNLQQTGQIFDKLKIECINLEGQIQILKELQSNENTN